MLNDQVEVLNTSFEPHGITFNLANISRTIDTNWAVDGAELEMKQSLRRGGYDALNVYFMQEVGGNLGVSDYTRKWRPAGYPPRKILDG